MLTLNDLPSINPLQYAMQASGLQGQKISQLQTSSAAQPFDKGTEAIKGALGGALTGLSLYSAAGGGSPTPRQRQQLSTPPPSGMTGAYSNPDGTYGVNPNTAIGGNMDDSLPQPESNWDMDSIFKYFNFF